MRLSILGAGGVGAAAAVVAAARGHAVTLWSPRGHSTAGIGDSLRAEGLLEGRFPVQVAVDLGRAVARAEAVLLAVPGHAQAGVMQRLAAVVQGQPALLVTPATGLSPLLLDRLLVARGLRIAIGAMAVTPVVAERLADDGVRIVAVRRRLWLGAVPAGMAAAFAPLCRALFGAEVVALPDALAAALCDVTPLLLAARALAPTLGPDGLADPVALSRLARALAGERDALGLAFGLNLPPAAAVYAELAGLPPVAAGRATDRALAEAPQTLAFLLGLGRARSVALPVAQSMQTLFEVMAGGCPGEHPLLEGLSPQQLARQLSEGAAAAIPA